MNFIFRDYPAHDWFAEWTLEPRDCSASFRANSEGRFFQTLETVGQLVSNSVDSEWTLQVPVPQNSRINMLFNGFCAYYDQKKKHVGAEVLIPEPGIIWGRFENIPAPILSDGKPVEQDGIFQWLETGNDLTLLAVRDGAFCLVSKSHLRSEAERVALQYLEKDFEAVIQREIDLRSGAKDLFEEMAHHDALAVISAESMMKALRPPEGNIPLHWCQASTTNTPMMDVNELPALAQAWRLMDIEMAEELVLCALKIQTNAGAIAVNYTPHTTHSILEAPKPMLVQTAETIWKVRKNDKFLTAIIPLLRRHLQWLLHHFDPKRSNIYCWKSAQESLAPNLYESDLATVDLAVLLISEVDALNRLRSESLLYASDPDPYETERETLENNILNQFWNNEENAFTKAFLRDQEGTLRGLPSFMPLLWPGLPHTYKINILERVHESGKLPGGLSVLSWRKSAMDDNSFPLIQQLLVFQALKQSDPHGQLLNDFSRITLQGFVEWHDLALEEEKRIPINPVLGAFIMNVQAIRQYRYHAKSGASAYFFKLMRKFRADRYDLIVIAATIFAVISVRLIYGVLNAPPPFDMLEAQMNSAYAERDIEGTLANCMAIINFYPDDSDKALLLAANISILRGSFPDAVELYGQVRERYPDSPGAMIGLGLANQLEGNFEEAEKNYYEFCYIFEEIFPELVEEVNHFRMLMKENFKNPPKWQNMYRYQLMHELE